MAGLRATSGILLALFAVIALRADERALEIARIHVEALGGGERLADLKALRIAGRAEFNGTGVRFTMLAARPNRLRLETHFPDRDVVQATDGAAPAWEFDPARPASLTAMRAETAALFLADADFDDPLVRVARGEVAAEFAGEAMLAGRKMWRLLVSRSLTENLFLLVDAETYLIAERRQTLRAGGRPTEMLTRYHDYRPVAGVLIAHGVELTVGRTQTQRATFESVQGVAGFAGDTFAPPRK